MQCYHPLFLGRNKNSSKGKQKFNISSLNPSIRLPVNKKKTHLPQVKSSELAQKTDVQEPTPEPSNIKNQQNVAKEDERNPAANRNHGYDLLPLAKIELLRRIQKKERPHRRLYTDCQLCQKSAMKQELNFHPVNINNNEEKESCNAMTIRRKRSREKELNMSTNQSTTPISLECKICQSFESSRMRKTEYKSSSEKECVSSTAENTLNPNKFPDKNKAFGCSSLPFVPSTIYVLHNHKHSEANMTIKSTIKSSTLKQNSTKSWKWYKRKFGKQVYD